MGYLIVHPEEIYAVLQGTCLAVGEIAIELGVSTSTVRRRLPELLDRGWITAHPSFRNRVPCMFYKAVPGHEYGTF